MSKKTYKCSKKMSKDKLLKLSNECYTILLNSPLRSYEAEIIVELIIEEFKQVYKEAYKLGVKDTINTIANN